MTRGGQTFQEVSVGCSLLTLLIKKDLNKTGHSQYLALCDSEAQLLGQTTAY